MGIHKKIKIVSQSFFFGVFLFFLFFVNTFPLAYALQSEWFLRLNPFVGVMVSLASRTFVFPIIVMSTIMILLTVVFGRFFCGFVCPLGAVIDFCDRVIWRSVRRKYFINLRGRLSGLQTLKYVLLGALVLAAGFGVLSPLFMDPIALLTRILTIVVYPFVMTAGAETLHLLRPAFNAVGMTQLAYSDISIPRFYTTITVAGLFLIVIGGGLVKRRFWCQYICPTGAFLGVVGRFAFFRRIVDTSACNGCGACARTCPTDAIGTPNYDRTRTMECIVCGECSGVTKKTCSRFGFARFDASTSLQTDLGRRHLIGGAGLAALLIPAYRAAAVHERDNTGRCIRPPGALPEEQFLSRCIACGECMKVCPTNIIQPCSIADGFPRVYTPKVVPRLGGCEQNCSVCSHVCPTGALRPIQRQQKPFVKIGTAVVDRHRCLAWAQGRECLVCDESCPYNAIVPYRTKTLKGEATVPVVTQELCVGCGMCERHCPVNNKAAIVVYRFGENRRASGAYMSAYKKKQITKERNMSDAARLMKDPTAGTRKELRSAADPRTGYYPGQNRSVVPSSVDTTERELPEGFLTE